MNFNWKKIISRIILIISLLIALVSFILIEQQTSSSDLEYEPELKKSTQFTMVGRFVWFIHATLIFFLLLLLWIFNQWE